MNRSYLIVHGWQASGPEHWQTWLANRLRVRGERVAYPLLPSPDEPVLAAWVAALHRHASQMTGERIVLCHSLGAVAWLHYVCRPRPVRVDRLLLVAPPCPAVMATIPELARFLPVPLDPQALARAAGDCRLVCSSGDPYCDGRAAAAYADPLGIPSVTYPPQAGHINVEAGFGPWPQVEAWCHNPEVALEFGDR